MGNLKIVMAELSDVRFDGRVRKVAMSLVSAGYDLHLYMYNASIINYQKYKTDGIQYHLFPWKGRYKDSDFLDKIKKYANLFIVLVKINIAISLSKADVYHLHNLFCAPGVLIGILRNKAKLVYDSHEVRIDRSLITRWFEKYIFSKSTLSFTASPIRSELIEKYYKIKRPNYLLNCPSNSKSRGRIKDREKERNDEIIIIFSGNYLVTSRLLDKVIQALRFLPDNVMFHLLGYGNQSEIDFLKEVSIKAGVKDRIFIFDSVPVDEVVSHLLGADIGVCLLRDINANLRYHALNKFYEYLAAGLAIIASDLTGFKKDIYENPVGKIGEICDGTEPKSISEAIMSMIKDENNLSRIKTNSKKLFENYWNWDIEEKRLIQLYTEQIGSAFVE